MTAAYPRASAYAIEAPASASIDEEGLGAPARGATGDLPLRIGVNLGDRRSRAARIPAACPPRRTPPAPAVDARAATALARALASGSRRRGPPRLRLTGALGGVSSSGEASDAAIVLGSLSSLFCASDGLLCFVALKTMKVTTPETSSSTRMIGIRYSM